VISKPSGYLNCNENGDIQARRSLVIETCAITTITVPPQLLAEEELRLGSMNLTTGLWNRDGAVSQKVV